MKDFSAKSYLINTLLGGTSPRAQIRLNLIINMVTGLAAALLLGFLNGHYDALHAKTGETPPRVIYYVYVFLGLVLVWQLFGFAVNSRLMKKLAGEKKKALPADEPADEPTAVASPPRQRSLGPGRLDPNGPESLTEHTTKKLDKLPRK
jgi:hypothetical protein